MRGVKRRDQKKGKSPRRRNAASQRKNTLQRRQDAWCLRLDRTWSSEPHRFDEDLKPVVDVSTDAWLEIRLVRQADQSEDEATFEVRSRLAIGNTRYQGRSVLKTIASLQQKLARQWNIVVPRVGTVKPYVRHFDPPELVRAYGARSTEALRGEAIDLLQSIALIAENWRLHRTNRALVTATTIYSHTRASIERDSDGVRLFRGVGLQGNRARPRLTLQLVVEVGRALGIKMDDVGKVESWPKDIEATPIRQLIAKVVAAQLSRRHGRKVEAVLRDVVNPIVTGRGNGALVKLTAGQARRMRRQLAKIRRAEEHEKNA